ncbi:MAG: M66 family metalloprotease [Gemmatimonadetes bacterium]|nr:M66 family metalloprotease [Gemmatimonadota bacterium]
MSLWTHDSRSRRPGALALVVPLALIAGCGDPDTAAVPEPPHAASIAIEPASARLVSLRERTTFTATVTDQYGATFPATVAWSSGDERVFTVAEGGTVTAGGNGTGTLTAAFEGVSTAVEVLVQQVPASLTPILGIADESDATPPAEALVFVPVEASTWPVAVRVLDAGGSPVAGVEVTFTPGEGHGAADPDMAATDDEGIARTVWTLGSAKGAQTLAATYAGGPSVQVAAAADTDRAALTELYNATGGPSWTRSDNWLSANPLATWFGVQVDTDGRVTSLALGGNNLSGPIPGQLGDLASLKILQLYANNLTGPIPAQLGKLANLEILFLEDNAFSGRLPEALGQLGKLEWFWVNDNEDLRGALPTSLTQVPLIQFQYSGTQLCVPMDAAFRVWLAGIQHHEGTGVECTQSERDILEAFYHATGGDITWEESDNWLTDAPLGDWYGVDTDENGNVIRLDLSGNFLVGRMPSELGQLSHLETLDLAWNGLFEGPIPVELFDLTGLTRLYLQGTDLGGPVPPEIGRLTNLTRLYWSSGSLTGPLPPELGNLAKLELLYMGYNYLTGPIPAELGNLTNLRVLDLYFNEHEGPIPPELVRLSSLEQLRLGNNHLFGGIPTGLGDLSDLWRLDLRNNDLTGGIPASLGNLSRLRYLYLNDNGFSGPIPASFINLNELAQLRVDGNALTGGLPADFGNLTNLDQLWVGDNEGLAGPVPTSLAKLQELTTLKAGGTGLCAPQDASLLEWLRGVPFQRLPRCEPALAYLTQSVQSREHPVPLVAGRPALLRVFVASARADGTAMPEVRATFYAGGAEVHTARIAAGSGTIPADIDEGSLDHSANADIPGDVIQAGLEVVIEVDPNNTLSPGLGIQSRIPATGRMAIDVVELPDFPLTLIPFLYEPDPDEAILDITKGMAADPENHPMLAATRDFLPVGEWDIELHDPVLTSTTNGFTIRNETEMMRRMEGARPGYWLAMQTPIRFGLLGVAYGIPSWTSFSQALPSTVAHEIGHNMGLWHAPCGGAGGPDPLYPHAWGVIGAWGYDREKRRLVSPHTPDLMSYCGGQWISEYHRANALRHRMDTEQAGGDWTPTRSLLVWGGVDADGDPYLEPSFITDALPGLPPAGNDFLLRGTTEDGREAFSYRFDMPETLDVDDGRTGFVFAIPVTWEGAISRIRLSGGEESFVLDGNTDLPMTILRDPVTGQVRAILRRPVTSAMGAVGEPDLEILFSRGIPE